MRDNRIDTIRGIAIVNMIIYHCIYDLYSIFGMDINITRLFPYQQAICWAFILVSGVSTKISKNRLKSLLMTLTVALTITIVTRILMPSEVVKFGVIHFFASAYLIDILLGEKLRKINPRMGITIFFILFLITYNIPEGRILGIELPKTLYNLNLFPLGFPSKNFYSSDYFPIIPWINLFYTGIFLGEIIEIKKEEKWKNPITLLGRHSLLVYVLHQPILFAVLSMIIN